MSYPVNKMLNLIEDVKDRITSNEYKNLLDNLMVIHNNIISKNLWIMPIEGKDTIGTRFYGQKIFSTYSQLVAVLGEVHNKIAFDSDYPGNTKTQYNWYFKINNIVFTIYDYKYDVKIEPDKTISWHIGAKSSSDSGMARKMISDLYDI
jgi:hypothetical protein